MRSVRMLLLLPLALVLVAPANATRPALVTGTAFVCDSNTATVTTLVDGIYITEITGQFALGGGLQGTLAGTTTFIVNSTTLQGTFNSTGLLFRGTINGSQPGTAVAQWNGTVDLPAGTTIGHWVIGTGTGGLAGVHGQGTLSTQHYATLAGCPATLPDGALGAYSLGIHFHPA